MLIQFQFLSFYKLSNTHYIAPKKSTAGLTASRTTNKLLTSNIHIFYLSLFLIHNVNGVSKQYIHSNNLCKLFFFFLPVKKKTVIFLRAPYKNKLARLQIVRLQYKFILSLEHNLVLKTFNNISASKILNLINSINYSSHKVKHSRTRIHLKVDNMPNYLVTNFN